MTGPARAERRHDVDWLRAIAIGLLIVYHIVLTFQPWASSIGFPQNDQLLEELIILVSMLSVWRIPLLFVISGMGVRFAMERRDWKALLKDRALRILVPYLFGIVVLNIALSFVLPLSGWDAPYAPNFGHLWFLLNIFLYVVWLLGILIYLISNPDNTLFRFLRRVMRLQWGLILFAIPLMVEAAIVNPEYFGVYVDTVHGWLIGLVCFFTGFVFISLQDDFWPAVARCRWIAPAIGSLLFAVRLFVLELAPGYNYLIALESMCWMLTAFALGARWLNRPSRTLSYLSNAAYPVYIVHLPVQFVIAYALLPTAYPPYAKLAVLTVATFAVSLTLFEFIRRIKWVRPLFGMKFRVSILPSKKET